MELGLMINFLQRREQAQRQQRQRTLQTSDILADKAQQMDYMLDLNSRIDVSRTKSSTYTIWQDGKEYQMIKKDYYDANGNFLYRYTAEESTGKMATYHMITADGAHSVDFYDTNGDKYIDSIYKYDKNGAMEYNLHDTDGDGRYDVFNPGASGFFDIKS